MAVRYQEWSIGIYAGASPYSLGAPPGVQNPVLTCHHVTDIPALFVADPFIVQQEHHWYMFFEVMHAGTERGEIGLASSHDGRQWQYQQIVLREPFHLSYPYVFAWGGEYYLVPESYQAGGVRLYRARQFPYDWTCIATLLQGPYFADASLFYAAETWWMFADTSADMQHHTLRLYYAPSLPGPWYEHAHSPVVEHNPHIARPAGRVIVTANHLLRFTQDCAPTYGSQVRAVEITTLTPTHYAERAARQPPILTASGLGWNADGMHHVDLHQLESRHWMASVDGFRWRHTGAEPTPADSC